MTTLAPSAAAAATTLRFAWFMVLAPAIGTIAAVTLLIVRGTVEPVAIALCVLFYILGAIGVEVGFHRYFSHRSFKTGRGLRLFMGLCGSAAGQGPVLYWAAVHRNHHHHTDTERDLHSPIAGGWRGFWSAHVGWLLKMQTIDIAQLTPDLIKDPTTMTVQRAYLAAFAAGLIIPAAIGGVVAGPIGMLEGFLWGGLVRVFANHHVTWAVNSLCHQFGTRPYQTKDRSGNLAWLALPSFGGAWHNNHHAFPASATNDYRWWQLDPAAWFIRAVAALRLAWDVRDGPGAAALERRSSYVGR